MLMMRSLTKAKPVLVLLACLLTAAASGDDFCLPNLVLQHTLPGGDVLPLDDPNEDFVRPSEAVSARQVRRLLAGGPFGFGRAARSRARGCCLPLTTALAVNARIPLSALNTPLRC